MASEIPASSNSVARYGGIAPGKVILLGEHAVVYGVPALAAALDQGARARVAEGDVDAIRFDGVPLAPEHELYRGLAAARSLLGAPPVTLELGLDIPRGSGLGASAALGVATARALGELIAARSGDRPSQARIAAAADSWERVFHGNPSGVDRAAAMGHGVLRYVRGEEPVPIVSARILPLVIAVAGPPASTREMVDGVARLCTHNPEQFAKNLAAIHALVDAATGYLRSGDLASLGKLLDLCQMILAGWMLSTEAIERALGVARGAGALGAKLTGSGGGGCIVALAPGDQEAEKIEQALNESDFPAFRCNIGANA